MHHRQQGGQIVLYSPSAPATPYPPHDPARAAARFHLERLEARILFAAGPLDRFRVPDAQVAWYDSAACDAPTLAATAGSAAAAGALDPAFGQDGKVATDWGGWESAYGAVAQPDGKLLVLGFTDPANYDARGVVIVRYNVDGSLDSTFGTNGITRIGDENPDYDRLLLDDAGNILVATHASRPGGGADYLLRRFNAAGQIDASFGDAGVLNLTDSGAAGVRGFVLRPDGKIAAAGVADGQVVYALINPDGTLDTSFGGGDGVVHTPAPDFAIAWTFAASPGGKLVIGGSVASPDGQGSNWGVLRLNADGSLDSTFGAGGLATLDAPGGANDVVGDLAVDHAGRVTAVSHVHGAYTLARFDADGTLDASFGSAGVVTGGSLAATSIRLTSDGAILVAGNGGHSSIALSRYLPTGALDTSFGVGGHVYTSFDPTEETANEIALAPDGRIYVLADNPSSAGAKDLWIARYDNTPLPGQSLTPGDQRHGGEFPGDLAPAETPTPNAQTPSAQTPNAPTPTEPDPQTPDTDNNTAGGNAASSAARPTPFATAVDPDAAPSVFATDEDDDLLTRTRALF
jgi:uncharacterized delta-60 repeat protein